MSRVPLRHRIYIAFISGLLWLYYRLYHRMDVEHIEYLPKQGPLLVILNHVSVLEVLALGAMIARQGITPGVNLRAVAKQELFGNAVLAWFARGVGMFPIDRERSDMSAMRIMVNTLDEGKVLVIAPEGTRSPTGRLQAFQPVIAKIAITRRLKILPVGAIGAERALPVGAKFPHPVKMALRFGPVFELSEFYDKPITAAEMDRASWVMRDHVARLLPEWMRELPPNSGRIGARKL